MPNTSRVKTTTTPVATTPPPTPKYTPPKPEVSVANVEQQQKIQKLIKYGGVKENKEKIQKESFYLTFNEREFLWNR